MTGKTIRVTTETGGVYIIRDATAFGPGVLGKLNNDETLRLFSFADTDKVEEVVR